MRIYGFKTPDAIHLAAAVVSGCDLCNRSLPSGEV